MSHRAFFPHTLDDVTRAIDGGLGLVVADMADGSLWVLKRERKSPGYTLTHYRDVQRTTLLSTEHVADRSRALHNFWEAVQDR